nr:IS110 family transposase [uncultured Clostridium sp.]
MIYTGIDVAKDKHDCFITNSDGEVLFKAFTISNNRDGFDSLYQKISSVADDLTKVKVGLEATGHYSYNLLGFLLDKGLTTFVINPLHTNLYRKSLSLRQTKTDKVDAHTIASMLMSDVNLKSYSDKSYHNEELKSLTRYRFDKVKERAKLKTSVSRLVTILFPELEKLVPTIHMVSVYSLLAEFPSASAVADAHLARLTHLLKLTSKGHYSKDTAITFREAARNSIGSNLRYALFNATRFVCHWDNTFATYLAKKRAEGKHYNVAISHAAKKLVRVIYQLEKSGQSYIK